MDQKEVDCDVTNWMYLAEDRDQWLAYVMGVINLWVPRYRAFRIALNANISYYNFPPFQAEN